MTLDGRFPNLRGAGTTLLGLESTARDRRGKLNERERSKPQRGAGRPKGNSVRKWLPLLIGMTGFVIAVLASIGYLAFSGQAGKARGLVVINLRTEVAVLTLDDGQTATFEPGEAHTIFARKPDFPQHARVTDAAGNTLFVEEVTYKQISDAEFRIGFNDSRIVYPAAPASKEIPI